LEVVVVSLDLGDLDLEAGSVASVGKGEVEKSRLTLNTPMIEALAAWVAGRGDWEGPLFVRLGQAAGLGPMPVR
jgi:site-specific recombinase XerC